MYTSKVEAFLLPYLAEEGYALDSVSFTKENSEYYLRVFLKRLDETGITIDDCVKVSRRLSKWLDKEDFIKEAYMLEVCSMGFKDAPEEGAADEETKAQSQTEEV